MSYKVKTVTVKDSSFLMEELKDFLVDDCGWTDETPSGQDDEMGAGDYHGILGHFLRSAGEDGTDDLCLHLYGMMPSTESSRYWQSFIFPPYSYLTSGINETDATADIDDDATLTTVDTPFAVRVGDELAIVSGVAAGVVTFSQRGAYGTTPAVHSAGDLVLDTNVGAFVEMYAYRDLTTTLLASSGTATVGLKAVTNVPGLNGYVDDRFNLHTFLKIVDGAEAGKMRPVTDYVSATGNFDYTAFLNNPGVANVALVSMGFLPASSRRISGTYYYTTPRIEQAVQGTDTVCWFYGSKDGVHVITKWGGVYDHFFVGNVVPFAAKDNAISSIPASAGANTMVVDNRNKFAVGEKYRIISQDADDWVANEDRPGTGPDLDPEEIPTEEVVIQSITPGTGDTGTLTFNANLIYDYATGAIIGEDPRPGVRTARDYSIIASPNRDLMEGATCWLPLYAPCVKTDLAVHASHRQTWRAVHATGDPETPSDVDFYGIFRGSASRDVNVIGDWTASTTGPNTNSKQNDRPTCGLVNLFVQNVSAAYQARGIFAATKGTLPGMWYTDVITSTPPYSAGAEDTYEARWGGAFEEFRIFLQRGSTSTFCIFGPEL